MTKARQVALAVVVLILLTTAIHYRSTLIAPALNTSEWITERISTLQELPAHCPWNPECR